MCKSKDPLSRARGADVLAQLGKTADHTSNSFPDESYSVITDLLQRETEPQPLAAGIAALGHLDNPLAVPLITNFSSHPSPEVRFDVAFALGCFPNEPRSAETLLRLTQDTDEDVRDWATFGLGVLGNTDSDEIREALVRRLNDSDEDVREEAMVGLGKRNDQRVLSSRRTESFKDLVRKWRRDPSEESIGRLSATDVHDVRSRCGGGQSGERMASAETSGTAVSLEKQTVAQGDRIRTAAAAASALAR